MIKMKVYEIMFAGGEVTELIANAIAEFIHAPCNIDDNEYML